MIQKGAYTLVFIVASKFLVRHVEDGCAGLLARGVAHEDVEAAKRFNGLGDQVAAEGFIAEIARDRDRLAAFRLDQPDDLLRVLFLVRQIIDGDIGTLSSECDGGRSPIPESPPVIRALRRRAARSPGSWSRHDPAAAAS